MSRGKTIKQSFSISKAVPKNVQFKNNPSILSKKQFDEIEARRKEKIIFSWQFFDTNNKLFNLGNTKSSWYFSLLDTLKSISQMTVKEFRQQASRRGLRVHGHDWHKATAKFNLPDYWFEQIQDDCLQFSISKARGRVHGFMIDNIFYIVWLDPFHNLYPTIEMNWKTVEYDFPLTDYEILSHDFENLKSENQKLKDELETCEELLNKAD